ncbi:MAG: hypothetical protein R3F31_21740 [Verrucomicrobiales bacterium]
MEKWNHGCGDPGTPEALTTKRELKRYEEVFDLFLKTVEHTRKSRQIDYQRWCTDQPFEEAFL